MKFLLDADVDIEGVGVCLAHSEEWAKPDA
jgi:hypothetical protein